MVVLIYWGKGVKCGCELGSVVEVSIEVSMEVSMNCANYDEVACNRDCQ